MALACHGAIRLPPAARPRPVGRLAALGSTGAKASFSARLAQQLRQLKQFKVWDGPAAGAAARGAQPAARGGRQATPARAGAPSDGAARPGAGGARRPGIVWFRGDLRLHDHEALSRAQAECSSLLPVFCFDPRDYGRSPQGYDKTGPYRARFLREAVAHLRAALRAAGSDLIVRLGRPEEVIGELVRQTGAAAVYCHTEVTYEEQRVEAAVRVAVEAAGARVQASWANTLAHLADLPFPLAQLPQSFDKFRERTAGVAVRAALPAPAELQGLPLSGRVDPGEIPTLQQLGLAPPHEAAAGSSSSSKGAGAGPDGGLARGGEGEALRQLSRFLAAAGGTARAGAAAGAAYGSNFASSIAPWLATGCLSPRRMLEDAQRALGSGAAGTSGGSGSGAAQPAAATAAAAQEPLSWVRFELLWRDFFRYLTLKYSELQLGKSAAAPAPAAAVAAAV